MVILDVELKELWLVQSAKGKISFSNATRVIQRIQNASFVIKIKLIVQPEVKHVKCVLQRMSSIDATNNP